MAHFRSFVMRRLTAGDMDEETIADLFNLMMIRFNIDTNATDPGTSAVKNFMEKHPEMLVEEQYGES